MSGSAACKLGKQWHSSLTVWLLQVFFGTEEAPDSGSEQQQQQAQQRSLSEGEFQQRLASRWNPRAAAADSSLSQ